MHVYEIKTISSVIFECGNGFFTVGLPWGGVGMYMRQVLPLLNLNVIKLQLGGALKKKSREVAQIQRRADLQVVGEKMERARVQAIVIADKKREQKSNKRQQKRLKEELETTQRSLEETREEKREEEKQTAAADRNQKKAMRKVAVLEQDISDMKVVVERESPAAWVGIQARWHRNQCRANR